MLEYKCRYMGIKYLPTYFITFLSLNLYVPTYTCRYSQQKLKCRTINFYWESIVGAHQNRPRMSRFFPKEFKIWIEKNKIDTPSTPSRDADATKKNIF